MLTSTPTRGLTKWEGRTFFTSQVYTDQRYRGRTSWRGVGTWRTSWPWKGSLEGGHNEVARAAIM